MIRQNNQVRVSKLGLDSISFGTAMVFVGSLTLDFRGTSEGGNIFQYGMAILALTFGSVSMIQMGAPSRETLRLAVLSFLIIGLGTLSAVAFGTPPERIARIALPFLLFAIAIWVGSRVSEWCNACCLMIRGMVLISLVSQLFRYWYASNLGQIHILDMRYQILSPVVLFPPAVLASDIVCGRRTSALTAVASAAAITTILLSVTRSFIIAGVVIVFVSIWLYARWGRHLLQNAAERTRRKLAVIVLGVSLATALTGAIIARQDVFLSWTTRLFEARTQDTGRDFTLVTRIAELSGIWKEMSAEPISILTGRGFGSIYQYDSDYAPELREIAPHINELFTPTWFPSHNSFVFALFFGGVGGLGWQVYHSWKSLRWALSDMRESPLRKDPNLLWVHCVVGLYVLITISQSLTANPFGERLACVFYGICVGALGGLASRRLQLNRR
jgi:hypothetical protein